MRTIAIAKKVVKELLRDKRTLALMFVAPVFIMWLMNLMFSASTTVNVKLATQDVPSSLVSKMDDLEHVLKLSKLMNMVTRTPASLLK